MLASQIVGQSGNPSVRHAGRTIQRIRDIRGVMTATPFGTLNYVPASTVDRVAEELRRSLFEGELAPGTPLREVALADALGVARSTVLVAEGLADRVPNKGTQVRRLDPAQVSDVCRARAVVEIAGVRRWAEAEDSLRDGVRRALAAYSELRASACTTAEFTAAHLEVHRAFAALTDSPRLVAFVDSLHAEVRLALARVDRARGNAAEQVHSHATLIDLLEAGELAAHLAEAEESMVKVVTELELP
jgi:DNA-binding GntR family transcriptional regulator